MEQQPTVERHRIIRYPKVIITKPDSRFGAGRYINYRLTDRLLRTLTTVKKVNP